MKPNISVIYSFIIAEVEKNCTAVFTVIGKLYKLCYTHLQMPRRAQLHDKSSHLTGSPSGNTLVRGTFLHCKCF